MTTSSLLRIVLTVATSGLLAPLAFQAQDTAPGPAHEKQTPGTPGPPSPALLKNLFVTGGQSAHPDDRLGAAIQAALPEALFVDDAHSVRPEDQLAQARRPVGPKDLLAAAVQSALPKELLADAAQPPPSEGPLTSAGRAAPVQDLFVVAGKSLVVESPMPIERVSVGFGDVAEAAAVAPREVLLNGKTPGVTSLIIWQRGGGKLFFDVTVEPNSYPEMSRIATLGRELKRELPGQNIDLSYENDTVFLRGRVKDLLSADRAVAIANTMGKAVNLLYVDVPPAEQQVLLKVRFATIDRTASLQLGMNLASTGGAKTVGSLSTQQFSPPTLPSGAAVGPTVSDALNMFLFRPDLNLLATIQALESKSLLEVLAEPNVLAMNGKPASFLAGGEFPFPTFQTGANGFGTVTVQFREFGVRLTFTPVITPRGTIRLQVSPEVSALDFTNGLVVQGFTVPAITIRKVTTEIELAEGQSFAIGGLIDNRITQTNDKLPILGDLPGLGKLFQSKTRLRTNTELVVIVTPQLVAPLPAGQPIPEIKYPQPPIWSKALSGEGNVPAKEIPPDSTIPFETLIRSLNLETPVTPPGTASQAAGQADTAAKSSAGPASR